MNADFYVVIGAKAPYGSFDDAKTRLEMKGTPKCNKKKPTVGPQEVALKFNIELPDTLFRRPMLTINTKVKESQKGNAQIIAQMQEEIADRLQDVQGVIVTIAAPDTEES